MKPNSKASDALFRLFCARVAPILMFLWGAGLLQGKPEIRQGFFDAFPSAVGSVLDTVPSRPGHCGVCHYRFNGGGTRNPFGVRVGNVLGNFPDTAAGLRDAIWSIRNEDPDNDGYSTLEEVTNTADYQNTPTFPGLTPSNVGSVSRVTVSEIRDHLIPIASADTTPPEVTVVSPNGGEILTANEEATVSWNASDPSGIGSIDLYVSIDGGTTFSPVVFGLANSGSYSWVPPNRPTSQALIRVVATDNASNQASDESDAVFEVVSPDTATVATTLRDFDMPGTQPLEGGIDLDSPQSCAGCHGNYDPQVEPQFNWYGSMMAHASRDPLFRANMTIANQDAADSGDLCLRCHLFRGWVQGRSVPTDGSRMIGSDSTGVSCDLCHRLVDPVPNPGVNPEADTAILAALSMPGTNIGNGMMVIDPDATRRGPFADTTSPHEVLVSPFHREAALCGTCHDVSNPAFEKNEQGRYVPNDPDQPASSFSPLHLLPVERTYSEWLNSDYNTPEGVSAPRFAGNKADGRVATCQDCHMRDVLGYGANPAIFGAVPERPDLPLHDMTGGSTWLPSLLPALYPGEVDEAAVQSGIQRATYMLENAADLAVSVEGSQLLVTITNQTGHKLPTGYPEGRRMWINVRFFDQAMNLLGESGAYDAETGALSHDAEAKIYEVEPGVDAELAAALPVEEGPSFHFVLNNAVFKDNRIPPRGFTQADFAAFGGAPVGHSYADGQYWDETDYAMPPGTVRAEVRLFYQSTSKEFIEFLRDTNETDDRGEELYAIWNDHGKCPPTLMAEAAWMPEFALLGARLTEEGHCEIRFLSEPGATYTIEYADELDPAAQWMLFHANGSLVAEGLVSTFVDDFTLNTSGSAPAGGMRFYRCAATGSP